jgi:hypothetical protein
MMGSFFSYSASIKPRRASYSRTHTKQKRKLAYAICKSRPSKNLFHFWIVSLSKCLCRGGGMKAIFLLPFWQIEFAGMIKIYKMNTHNSTFNGALFHGIAFCHVWNPIQLLLVFLGILNTLASVVKIDQNPPIRHTPPISSSPKDPIPFSSSSNPVFNKPPKGNLIGDLKPPQHAPTLFYTASSSAKLPAAKKELFKMSFSSVSKASKAFTTYFAPENEHLSLDFHSR